MVIKKEIKEEIRKQALYNLQKFGKANEKAVLGAILSSNQELRKKVDEVRKEINTIVKDVNSLSKEGVKKELEKLPKKEVIIKEKTLKELPNAKKGKVVMRFSPSPSGPLHLGHAIGISLNSEYCKEYKGKLILRIEDTNPENIYSPAYKMLEDDAQWITKNNVKEVLIQSDRLGFYYDYAEKLVNMGKAYVCECSSDAFRELILKKKACSCRDLKKKEHELRYAKMFSEYKPGEAVLRMKTDIENPNPAMRDFPLMRINENKHPRKGTEHRVWPLMNLAVFVDDAETKVTHIIRAKDHMDNAKRQELLYNAFKLPIPIILFFGRLNFKDLKISASETRKLILEGKYTGWDDSRLPFIQALKRRGYTPEAFVKLAIELGLSQNDKTVRKEDFFKSLDSYNREVIDPIANRFFFIGNPKKIKIKNVDKRKVNVELHPDFEMRGYREFNITEEFYIEEKDYLKLQDGLHRLMNCINFTKTNNKFEFHSNDYENYKESGKMIIHWLTKDNIPVEIMMPDGSVKKGLAEKSLKKVKAGEMIQFERFGFCRFDKREKDKIKLWFTH
ncbi:glutamate--tRNA ligase [Nanoarchaeota archaeon]